MPRLHELQILQEEWNPTFVKTSFDWPALRSNRVVDDVVEYVGRSPGTGWGVSFCLSRVAKPLPTKSKKGGPMFSVWELAASRFHPCANHMRRSCEGAMVTVEASFHIRVARATVTIVEQHRDGRRSHKTLTVLSLLAGNCSCHWHPSPLRPITVHLTSNDSEVVPLDVLCNVRVPTSMSRLIVTVTITSSPNSRNFFDILEDVKTQSSLLNWEHDQTRIHRERAGVRALQQSLKSGVFFDIRLLAYSRRSTHGHVMVPSPLYANTSVLAAKSQNFDFSGSNLADAMGCLFVRDPEDQSSGLLSSSKITSMNQTATLTTMKFY
ncbi:hypothetical protein BU15DRAFT_84271 [Melanogaster broomeanus]|nr:hypothetical protein BU15DRAFT_84271 [Melanogaster broomeanus]